MHFLNPNPTGPFKTQQFKQLGDGYDDVIVPVVSNSQLKSSTGYGLAAKESPG